MTRVMASYQDIYTTVAGDMWDLISYRIYGNERYMAQLLEANPQHSAVMVFGGGVELVVPDIVVPVAATLPVWARP